ncbi:hypothetical protein ACE6H2_023432 [Prunus campanulata]
MPLFEKLTQNSHFLLLPPPSIPIPRRRLPLLDFIFANFFTISLSISIFFFLVVILCYGVPSPLSFHFKSKSSTRFPKPRKSASRKPVSVGDVLSGKMVEGFL